MQNVKNDHLFCRPVQLAKITLYVVAMANSQRILIVDLHIMARHHDNYCPSLLISWIYYNDAPIHDAYACLCCYNDPLYNLQQARKREATILLNTQGLRPHNGYIIHVLLLL